MGLDSAITVIATIAVVAIDSAVKVELNQLVSMFEFQVELVALQPYE